MRKLLLLIVVAACFVPKSSYSQERVNKPIPQIGIQIGGQLTKATGWLLNPQGQWVSGLNRIPAYSSITMDVDDFVSYQFREIKIQDSAYLIFIKKHGKVVTKQGITNYSFLFYVFNKGELKKLDNIINDTINLIKIDVLYSGDLTSIINGNYLTGITNDTYIPILQKEIARQIIAKTDSTDTDKELAREGESINEQVHLIFHIAPYKAKNIVQFQIYSSLGEQTDGSAIIIEGVTNELGINEDISGDQFYLTNDLFKHCYFETDYPTFNSFIKLTH